MHGPAWGGGGRGETGSTEFRWKQEKVRKDFSRGQEETAGHLLGRGDDGVHRGWREWHMQCLLGNSGAWWPMWMNVRRSRAEGEKSLDLVSLAWAGSYSESLDFGGGPRE